MDIPITSSFVSEQSCLWHIKSFLGISFSFPEKHDLNQYFFINSTAMT